MARPTKLTVAASRGEKAADHRNRRAAWLLDHREGSRLAAGSVVTLDNDCVFSATLTVSIAASQKWLTMSKRPSARPPIVETGAAAWLLDHREGRRWRHRQGSRGWTRWRSRLTGFAATLTVSIDERYFLTWSMLKTYLGVSDRSALATWPCARRSMGRHIDRRVNELIQAIPSVPG
jgi:hypothetical protein